METAAYRKEVLGRLREALTPEGFSKLGANAFSRQRGDVLHLVEIQRGKWSTKSSLELTVNLGVLSLELAKRTGRHEQGPQICFCHWSARLGELMPEQQDKWWEISSATQVPTVADEVVDALIQYGLPALSALDSTQSLKNFWESGRYGGLTEFLRDKYLDLLRQ